MASLVVQVSALTLLIAVVWSPTATKAPDAKERKERKERRRAKKEELQRRREEAMAAASEQTALNGDAEINTVASSAVEPLEEEGGG